MLAAGNPNAQISGGTVLKLWRLWSMKSWACRAQLAMAYAALPVLDFETEMIFVFPDYKNSF